MLTLFFVIFAMQSHAERPAPPRQGVYTLTGDLTYFKTNANFTEDSS